MPALVCVAHLAAANENSRKHRSWHHGCLRGARSLLTSRRLRAVACHAASAACRW